MAERTVGTRIEQRPRGWTVSSFAPALCLAWALSLSACFSGQGSNDPVWAIFFSPKRGRSTCHCIKLTERNEGGQEAVSRGRVNDGSSPSAESVFRSKHFPAEQAHWRMCEEQGPTKQLNVRSVELSPQPGELRDRTTESWGLALYSILGLWEPPMLPDCR